MTQDSEDLSRQVARIGAGLAKLTRKNQRAFADLVAQSNRKLRRTIDPMNTGGPFVRAAGSLALNPSRLVKANLALWGSHLRLLANTMAQVLGADPTPIASAERGDRRFRDDQWDDSPVFSLIKQSYLLTSRALVQTMSSLDGMGEQDARKVAFYTRQFADAMAPSNFFLTNPQVLRATVETRGRNLVTGMGNLLRDLNAGDGELRIAMTDADAFEVGRNVATTPGKIVYQNDLVQLIQYQPTTKRVYRRPLVIIPPWINKYYILDLQPANSFIAWAVARGYTVFVASWVNPDQRHSTRQFEDYMQEGILDVLDAVELATGEREVNMIGYCIGGTLLAATLSYMAATGDDRVKAATFFAAQTDFSEPGDLALFVDETQVDNLDALMDEKGYLDGKSMATTFNMLRANDLIWSFFVDNYLLGKKPLEFDLLYWNADATRMPRQTHLFYLREMYIKNRLAQPGGITLKGVPIDLSNVEIPIYLQASREDHIAPCNSVFKATGLFSGPVRFVLAGSGHIAGVINPPAAKKYNYWMNDAQPKDLQAWLDGAQEHPGSWWPDWNRWLGRKSGQKIAARVPGDGKLDVLEDAPGSYVASMS